MRSGGAGGQVRQYNYSKNSGLPEVLSLAIALLYFMDSFLLFFDY